MCIPCSSDGKESACNAGDLGSTPGSGRSSGEGSGNRFSILAWVIPWTEEPGRLQFVGLQRGRHDWATDTTATTSIHWWSWDQKWRGRMKAEQAPDVLGKYMTSQPDTRSAVVWDWQTSNRIPWNHIGHLPQTRAYLSPGEAEGIQQIPRQWTSRIGLLHYSMYFAILGKSLHSFGLNFLACERGKLKKIINKAVLPVLTPLQGKRRKIFEDFLIFFSPMITAHEHPWPWS